MRITRIETIPVRVPIKPELAIRSGRGGAHLVSPFLLVKIHTDEGIVGLGEASCTPRWSGEDQVSAAHFIDNYFAPLLLGEVIGDIDLLSAKYMTAVAGNYFTKAAVEMALWDIAGKVQSKPVWQLLTESYVETLSASRVGAVEPEDRAKPRPSRTEGIRRIPTKWSVSGVEPTKAAEIAEWALKQGFQTMKVKVGIDPPGDLARVKAVREAVGPHVKLGVDANGGWSTPQIAIDTINQLHDECDVYFAEQPVTAADLDGMAEVRRNVSVPIVADECIFTLDDAKRLAHAKAADVFSIYVGKAGGIAPAADIIRFAQSDGIQCTIGSNLELGVGTAAMIHLALSAPGMDVDAYPCDIIGPLFYEADILVMPLGISGGSAGAIDRPGLGVDLNDVIVEKYRVR
jgi:muconate cycloisomerase